MDTTTASHETHTHRHALKMIIRMKKTTKKSIRQATAMATIVTRLDGSEVDPPEFMPSMFFILNRFKKKKKSFSPSENTNAFICLLVLDGWRRRKCGIESTNPTVSLGSGKCNGRFWQSVVVPWANDGRWGNVSSRAAINRRGRAVVLKRTRILDKYSETFMMAGALPGKEKTNTKDNKSRALKYYFFFLNLEATFACLGRQQRRIVARKLPRAAAAPESSPFCRRIVIDAASTQGKASTSCVSLSPRQLKRFNPIHIQRRKKWNAQEASLYLATGNRLSRQAHLSRRWPNLWHVCK